MNPNSIPFDRRIAKPNGKVFPAVERLASNIPYWKVSLPWMAGEEKFTYASNLMMYRQRVHFFQDEIITTSIEEYYENRLYETIVGSLLRKYLSKDDPDTVFYYTSQHDDYYSACDYIVGQPGNKGKLMRIDLTVSNSEIRSFEDNYTQATMRKKIRLFHRGSGIPEEFFQSVHPDMEPTPLPLIILRVNRPILAAFAHDFFKTMARGNTKIDILEHFSWWIHNNSAITQNRIAYILGMEKNPGKSSSQYEQIAELSMQIGRLFAGISDVELYQKI